jgi:hypothetical protein
MCGSNAFPELPACPGRAAELSPDKLASLASALPGHEPVHHERQRRQHRGAISWLIQIKASAATHHPSRRMARQYHRCAGTCVPLKSGMRSNDFFVPRAHVTAPGRFPRLSARAPRRATQTPAGTGGATIACTIRRVAASSPPDVSRRPPPRRPVPGCGPAHQDILGNARSYPALDREQQRDAVRSGCLSQLYRHVLMVVGLTSQVMTIRQAPHHENEAGPAFTPATHTFINHCGPPWPRRSRYAASGCTRASISAPNIAWAFARS